MKALDLFPRETHMYTHPPILELSDSWMGHGQGPQVKNLTTVSDCTWRGCGRDILNNGVLTVQLPVDFVLDGIRTELQTRDILG